MSVSLTLPVQLAESVVVIWRGKLPVCVGVPLRTPALKVIPVGNAPDSANVAAPIPPDSVKVTGVYAVPELSVGNEVGATVIVGQAIWSE